MPTASSDADRQQTTQVKLGLFWLGVSYFCGTVFFLVSKYLLGQFDRIDFFYWWYGSALIFIEPFNHFKPEPPRPSLTPRVFGMVALYILLDVAATTTFILGIDLLDPSVAAFLSQSQIAFVVLFSYLILGETLNLREVGAGVVIALGVVLMCYHSGTAPLAGSALMVFANLAAALSLLIVRRYGTAVGTFTLTRLRTVVLFVVYLSIRLIMTGRLYLPPVPIILITIAGSCFGPFLNTYSLYKALEYMTAGKLALFRSLQPLFVMIAAAFFLGLFPGGRETLGGIITVIGSVLLAWFHTDQAATWRVPLRSDR